MTWWLWLLAGAVLGMWLACLLVLVAGRESEERRRGGLVGFASLAPQGVVPEDWFAHYDRLSRDDAVKAALEPALIVARALTEGHIAAEDASAWRRLAGAPPTCFECGRSPRSLEYRCEYCPLLSAADRIEWRRLNFGDDDA